MSRLLHVCLSVSALGLCAGPAVAQQGSHPAVPADLSKYYVTWPSEVNSGSFLSIEPGNYDGDGIPDAAVLRGTKPVILLDPAIMNASLVLPCDVIDIARLAHGGLNGQDVVVTLAAGGLTLWDLDPMPQGGAQTYSQRSVGSSQWVGALQVVSGDVDGDNDEDLLGVGANGLTILILANNGAGSFTSQDSVTAGAPVRQLGVVEWDGDSVPEIWALTTKALDVYDLAPPPHYGDRVANNRNFSLTDQLDAVAVLRHPQPDSATKDKIVWVTKASATTVNQKLLVLYQGGYENPFLLEDLGVVALATGDFDHDTIGGAPGDADLLMSEKDQHVIRRIENKKAQGAPRAFDGYPLGAVDFWAGNAGSAPNLCTLPWLDWDNDGQLDMLFAVQPLSRPLLYPAIDLVVPEFDQDHPYELIASGHPAFIGIDYTAGTCLGNGDGRLFIDLNNPWGAQVAHDNVIDLVVYEQQHVDPISCPYPTDLAIRHHQYRLDAPGIQTGPDTFRISVMIPQVADLFDGRYFCQVRVILDLGGPNEQALRSYVGGFTSDLYVGSPIMSWGALMALPNGWPGSIPCDFDYCGGLGNVNGGGFRPLSRMPAFEPGHSPQPGLPTPPPSN